ncbi:MAG: universal stress protein [Desulfobacterales bacterium]|nr:universal stress protein [Desulfobacterales bacterium]MCP4160939.1 universal stress protein [Deltaproteobacteria bacterium]
MEIKKIMVALAFTKNAQAIFDYAAGFAEKFSSEIVAISVINSRDVEAIESVATMGYNIDSEHYTEDIKKERNELLEGIIKNSKFPKEKVKTVYKIGNPTDEILSAIVDESIDMIVLGVKGHTNLEHVFIGSVADKIFRKSPIPVVSFRPEGHANKLLKRIKKYT